jgi:hypothetical protein
VSIVLETASTKEQSVLPQSATSCAYFLPFSHQCSDKLDEQIAAISAWALRVHCPLSQLAAILGLCREHHQFRKAIIARSLDDLFRLDRAQEFENLEDDSLTIKAPGYISDSSHTSESELVALCRAYERGETLPFSTLYDKKNIQPALLASFPFYFFNRHRCWKDMDVPSKVHLTSPNDAPVLRLSSSRTYKYDDENQVFTDLIAQYGAAFPQYAHFMPKTALSIPSRSCILLTGANGMLGARLLSLLVRLPNITVCCPIRGDGWKRLKVAFTKQNLDLDPLQAAYDRGAVRVFSISDLCAPQLGLSQLDYDWLCRYVDQIVHAAWSVNFNLPLSEFDGLLRCTRNLAELCLIASKRVRYFFIGTHASTFEYEGQSVPESIIPPRRADAMQQASALLV